MGCHKRRRDWHIFIEIPMVHIPIVVAILCNQPSKAEVHACVHVFDYGVASLSGMIILLLFCSLCDPFNNWKITSLSFLVYGHVFLAGIALYSVGSAIKLPCIVLRFVVCPRLTYFYTLSSVRVDKSSQDSPMILILRLWYRVPSLIIHELRF